MVARLLVILTCLLLNPALSWAESPASFIKQYEGWSATPYKCPAGHWTIGYGHRILEGESFTQITKAEGEALLAKDLEPRAALLASTVNVPLTENQKTALISLIYNIGGANFKQSTLLKKLNKGDFDGARKQFSAWIYAKGKVSKGLVARRKAEAALFGS